MRTRVRGWRWRRNPLRRRSDVVEAWTVLAVAVLLFVGAPLTGAAVGWWRYDNAQARAAAQRAERHRVSALLVETAPAAVPSPQGARPPTFRVKVRWTEPGKGARTGEALVPAGGQRGDRVDVWLDAHGRNVGPPVSAGAIWQHALTTGASTAAGVVAVVLAWYLTVRRITARRRLAEWERDWAHTGPEWRRHTA
jgi:ABC-type Fe3+ transport system permease subunit